MGDDKQFQQNSKEDIEQCPYLEAEQLGITVMPVPGLNEVCGMYFKSSPVHHTIWLNASIDDRDLKTRVLIALIEHHKLHPGIPKMIKASDISRRAKIIKAVKEVKSFVSKATSRLALDM